MPSGCRRVVVLFLPLTEECSRRIDCSRGPDVVVGFDLRAMDFNRCVGGFLHILNRLTEAHVLSDHVGPDLPEAVAAEILETCSAAMNWP